MATITSVQSGNWSNSSTWYNGHIPADGDTVIIEPGHTVTFDVDQSSFANGVDLTVDGTLQASETAGSYYLKCSANIDGSGEVKAGTSEANPYPSNCEFTIDLNGHYISGGGNLLLNLFCAEPSIRWTRLSSGISTGATSLPVVDDVSAEWSNSKNIWICKHNNKSSYSGNLEQLIISSMTSTTINVSAGVSQDYPAGAFIAYEYRNVQIINPTTSSHQPLDNIKDGSNVFVYLESGYGFANSILNFVGGGFWLCNTTSTTDLCKDVELTFKGICVATVSSRNFVHNLNYKLTLENALFMGLVRIAYESFICEVNNVVSVCNYCCMDSAIRVYGTSLTCYGQTVSTFQRCYIDIENLTVEHALYVGILTYGSISNLSTTDVDYGITYSSIVSFYNGDFSGIATENGDYNFSHRHSPIDFSVSYDHNKVSGAVKAWTLGGLIIKDTTDIASLGYSYQLVPEQNSDGNYYWCFWEEEYELNNDDELFIKAYYLLDSNITEAKAQLVNVFEDPLIDSNATALAEGSFNAANYGIQQVNLHYSFTDETPKRVKLRLMAKGDGNCYMVARAYILQKGMPKLLSPKPVFANIQGVAR